MAPTAGATCCRPAARQRKSKPDLRTPSRGPLPVVVDAMGGDDAPGVVIDGALGAAGDGIPVCLVGPPDRIRHVPLPRIDAPDHVGMDEAAVAGVRRSPDSSVRRGLRAVAEGRGSAFASCGNTGAVVVAAMLDLGLEDGVKRPPIATTLPRADGGELILLDTGAHVDARAALLADFARLGFAYAKELGNPRPRVGLLANGVEATKGTARLRETVERLDAMGLPHVGFVEPHAALEGACDVLVTDGFVGNVLLKAGEGTVQLLGRLLGAEIRRDPIAKIGAWLLRAAARRLRRQVEWEARGGGVLLGVRGTVVVGHGRATRESVRQAIHLAHRTASARLTS
ncbi:MAG: phosphate--acyl-ACP acyltransferase [Myxococcota bacterium]